MTGDAQTIRMVPSRGLVELDVECERSERALRLRAKVRNTGRHTIFVLDSLWTLDRDGRPRADERGILRAKHGNVLRLVLGSPPMPIASTVGIQLTPFGVPVSPGNEFELERTVSLPIEEYNPYSPTAGATFVDDAVTEVEVFVQFVTAREDTDVRASPFDSRVIVARVPQFGSESAEVAHARAVLRLPVRRRTGQFTRLSLPGESIDASELVGPFGGLRGLS